MKPTSYVGLWIPGHPLAVDGGKVSGHRKSLYDAIGVGPHPCHWCRRELRWGRGTGPGKLTVDHLDRNPQNNQPDNLVPSCHGCNVMRGRAGHTIGQDEKFVFAGRNKDRKVRARDAVCRVCHKEFLVAIGVRVGRFCSKQCAGVGKVNPWIKRRARVRDSGLPTTS